MQTYKAKRVEIAIEAVMEGRLTAALVKAGVTGFTVLSALGGSGRSGQWIREGQVSRARGIPGTRSPTRNVAPVFRASATFALRGRVLSAIASARSRSHCHRSVRWNNSVPYPLLASTRV